MEFPVADPRDESYMNVPLFILNTRLNGEDILELGADTIKFPKKLHSPEFSGLCQFDLHPELFHIVVGRENQYSILPNKCYCMLCEEYKSSSGGNYMKHLRMHEKLKQNCSNEHIKMIMLWSIDHNIPFNALQDPTFKKLHKGFVSNAMQYKVLEEYS